MLTLALHPRLAAPPGHTEPLRPGRGPPTGHDKRQDFRDAQTDLGTNHRFPVAYPYPFPTTLRMNPSPTISPSEPRAACSSS